MEAYYQKFINWPGLKHYTIQGLFNGDRSIDKIVTLQEGTMGKVFFFDQEPIIKGLDIELWDHIFSEPTILANSELDSEDKDWLKEKYPNFIDWYFFSHALVSREWFSHYRNCEAGKFDHTGKPFLTDFGIITNQRQYRLFMYIILEHLITKFRYSLNINQNWESDLHKNDYFNILKDFSESYKNILPKENISYDNFGKDATLAINNFKQNLISYPVYSQSSFILILETAFQTPKKHLTEKIFKAIVAGKPFILAAGKGNLQYLRNYGFKTFGDYIDESYDNEADDKKRCFLIKWLIESISNRIDLTDSTDANEMINKCHSIARYNREYFWSEEFMNVVYDEAIYNFKRAQSMLSAKRHDKNYLINTQRLQSFLIKKSIHD